MKKALPTIFILAFLLSCQTEPQTDYVELIIPAELQNNEEAVEKLKSDAEQLNRVFNSVEEIMLNITRLKEDFQTFDEQTDTTAFKSQLRKRIKKIEWSAAKFTFNLFWLGLKDYNTDKGHREILEKLSKGETIQYKKCLNHLQVKKDIVLEKYNHFTKELDELLEVMKEKTEIYEKRRNG